MKKVIHADRIKWARQAAMLQVMELLDWSEDKYCWLMYETGMEYLRETLSAADADMMCRTREYWGWWKLEWHIRESDWLRAIQVCQTVGQYNRIITCGPLQTVMGRRIVFYNIHDARQLARMRVMEDSYCRELGRRIKGGTLVVD